MKIYENPLYYEIAFSFFDPKQQIDSFERIIKRFSKIKVRSVLDVACGPSLQLLEFARRGYDAVGLDLCPEMLAYLQGKAKEEGVRIETVQADMCDFRLERKVDFTFVMMGSLVVDSDEKLLSHLNSVACSLKRGGLYFIQNKAVNWPKNEEQTWTMEKDGITVKTTFSMRWKNLIDQIYTERIVIEVKDHGHVKQLREEEELKFVFPQEFKTLIRFNGKFEFLGWWKGTESTWHLDKPLEKPENLDNINMVLLRRK